MPLPSNFAFDTETDRFGDDVLTCMIQVCPISAGSLDDVSIILGLDCYERFLDRFEETQYNMDCHMYNLDYEFKWLKHWLGGYEFVPFSQKRLARGQWTCSSDNMTTYCVKICNRHGKVLKITDDMKRLGGCSMETAGKAVRGSHPDWFMDGVEVKEKADYNTGWFSEDAEDHWDFIRYGTVDAYTQAMIARYIVMNGLDKSLTAASNGFMTALLGKYQDSGLGESDGKVRRYARMDFTKHYPPLDREMQDTVERSLLGGFVWGRTGDWRGTFVHLDYSSSYPYEYAYGDLGKGRVIKVDREQWGMLGDNLLKWYVVSFDFKYKGGPGMPCLSGKDCRGNGRIMAGGWNKKMREGRVEHMLYTESYLREI